MGSGVVEIYVYETGELWTYPPAYKACNVTNGYLWDTLTQEN